MALGECWASDAVASFDADTSNFVVHWPLWLLKHVAGHEMNNDFLHMDPDDLPRIQIGGQLELTQSPGRRSVSVSTE
jgi:hypothetical protein